MLPGAGQRRDSHTTTWTHARSGQWPRRAEQPVRDVASLGLVLPSLLPPRLLRSRHSDSCSSQVGTQTRRLGEGLGHSQALVTGPSWGHEPWACFVSTVEDSGHGGLGQVLSPRGVVTWAGTATLSSLTTGTRAEAHTSRGEVRGAGQRLALDSSLLWAGMFYWAPSPNRTLQHPTPGPPLTPTSWTGAVDHQSQSREPLHLL